MDSLPVQEFSSSDGHWSVGRINQVIHILTVLIRQGIFTAPVINNQYELSLTVILYLEKIMKNKKIKCKCSSQLKQVVWLMI